VGNRASGLTRRVGSQRVSRIVLEAGVDGTDTVQYP